MIDATLTQPASHNSGNRSTADTKEHNVQPAKSTGESSAPQAAFRLNGQRSSAPSKDSKTGIDDNMASRQGDVLEQAEAQLNSNEQLVALLAAGFEDARTQPNQPLMAFGRGQASDMSTQTALAQAFAENSMNGAKTASAARFSMGTVTNTSTHLEQVSLERSLNQMQYNAAHAAKEAGPTRLMNLDGVSALSSQPALQTPLQAIAAVANGSANVINDPAASPSQTLSTTPATASAEWASVRVDTSAGKWGEQMLQVLNDRVTLQAQQNLQEAKIRLDPPDLGKLDLMVRVEGDRLSVQINANAAATREALLQVSERLRAELQNQNFVHVEVNVGSDKGREGQHNPQSDDEMTVFSASNHQNDNTTFTQSEHWLSTQA
jgi:flagellar hook-length control protein FliK